MPCCAPAESEIGKKRRQAGQCCCCAPDPYVRAIMLHYSNKFVPSNDSNGSVLQPEGDTSDAYLLRIPSPSQNEFPSYVWDLDFINNGPHVAWLACTEHRRPVSF